MFAALLGLALVGLRWEWTPDVVHALLVLASIGGICFLATFVTTQELWRITSGGVAHASTILPRQCARIAWHEINAVRFEPALLAFKSEKRRIMMRRANFRKDDWLAARAVVYEHLGEAFDLEAPSAWDLEGERRHRLSTTVQILHWLRLVAIAIGIFASLVVGGFLLFQINPDVAFYGSFMLALAWLFFGGWAAARDEHARWRHRR